MAKKNIAARRKLTDLYVKGEEVRFDAEGATKGPFESPPTDDQVCVWVQPPSPLQREMALRDAQATRARAVLNAKRDNESEERLTALSFIEDMGPDTLIEYVMLSEADDRRREAMRDVLGYEEWADISELQDAMRQFDEADASEDDPEFAALLEKDVEFGKQIDKRVKELEEAAREVMKQTPKEKLEERALARRADLQAGQVFMRTYERHMLFYACRVHDDHTELFFEDVTELSEQPDFVIEQLGDVLASFIQDGGQAKNSLRAVSSSASSAPPAEPETSEASTPEESTE